MRPTLHLPLHAGVALLLAVVQAARLDSAVVTDRLDHLARAVELLTEIVARLRLHTDARVGEMLREVEQEMQEARDSRS